MQMLFQRTAALAILLATATCGFAQEAGEAAVEPTAEEQLAGRVEAIEAEIAQHRETISMLESRVAASEGLGQTLFLARLDEAQVALFDATIRLAMELSRASENGLDVSAYVDETAEDLRSLPDAAIAAANRIRDRIVLQLDPESPEEAVLSDQQLLIDSIAIDQIYNRLLAYIEIGPQLGLDVASERQQLADLLSESAANRSVFLEVATREAGKLRTSVSTLPANETLKAWLAVTQARESLGSRTLQSAVNLMNRLELDTLHYRQQLLAATGEITTDVLDVGFVASLMAEWSATMIELIATDGPRLVFRVLLAIALFFAFIQAGKIAQKIAARGIGTGRVSMSSLLQRMLLSAVRNIIIIVGLLVALSQLGISLGPLLAGLGIAGFIVGFALQDSLSNFASGMMILVYRPFDVGDFVEVAGVKGKVDNMSLVNTTFLTFDNQKLVVPNNMVWQSVIANYTDQSTRRVDLTFGISYSDDIDKAEAVIREVLAGYDTILEEPAPVIKVGELGESSVNLIVRPWVRTDDYWDTYWDLTKLVKQAFDREGITIPFPQRDVHMLPRGDDT